MKASWNGHVLATSEQTIVIENNHYFPPDSVDMDLLRENSRRSTCPWKGEAHYFDIVIEGNENRGAAWSYPHPKEGAAEIAGYIAFWKGVEITD